MTPIEMVDTLTGTEDEQIQAAFGHSFESLGDGTRGYHGLRSLLFVMKVREGKPTHEAKAEVMAMTRKAVEECFEDEPDDVQPDEPDSPAGKGSSPSVSEPEPSPDSAWPPDSAQMSFED